MPQGWIEWAKVCKLTILHDLATFTWGSDHNYVLVDIVMTRGVCFIYYVVQIWSKPCLSLSFAFIWKAKCLLLLLPPPSSLPWSGPSPHCMRLRWTPSPHPTLCLYLSYSLNDMSFLFSSRQILFHIVSLSFIMPFYDLFQLEMVCTVWEVCVFVHLPSYWML